MDFRAEKDKKKIREFLDLVENHKVEIRHYKNPVLVWANLEGVCHYTADTRQGVAAKYIPKLA